MLWYNFPLQDMPGAPGMKVYSKDDLMNGMPNFNGDGDGDGDEDEEEDEEEDEGAMGAQCKLNMCLCVSSDACLSPSTFDLLII